MRNLPRFALLFTLIAFAATLASASTPTPANCKPDFSACFIPENVLLQLPFLAVAGDVVVQDLNSANVSDIFRIFNNVVDTGAGTGLGDLAILISGDDLNRANEDDSPLGDASRHSANAVFLPEAASGPTSYLGNGTNYVLDTSAIPTSLTYTGDRRADAQHSAQFKARLTLRESGDAVPDATVQFTLGLVQRIHRRRTPTTKHPAAAAAADNNGNTGLGTRKLLHVNTTPHPSCRSYDTRSVQAELGCNSKGASTLPSKSTEKILDRSRIS